MGRIAPHLPEPDNAPSHTALLGQPAPEFQLKDEQGNAVTLRRLIRPRPLMLYIYRGGW